MLKKVINSLKKRSGQSKATIIPRSEHGISRKDIERPALKILYRLKDSDHPAYLVGGCVRDLLLHKTPKDFDVVTQARPQQVKRLFSNAYIIGRRFRLVHVYTSKREFIEVSTFRAGQPVFHEAQDKQAMIQQDNQFGTIDEDVWRRDFTINAMYYNIEDFSIVDYTGGYQDIQAKIIRIIGDAEVRFHEDPVRMLRAVRFAAKLDFKIEAKTEAALRKHKELLKHVPRARMFDEVLKLFFTGHAVSSFKQLQRTDYFSLLFNEIAAVVEQDKTKQYEKLLIAAFEATDQRYQEELVLNPAFLLAVFGWPVLQERMKRYQKRQYKRVFEALHHAIEDVMGELTDILAVPKKFTAMIRSMWMLQYHMMNWRKNRVFRIINHRYFRAAIDFLEMRAAIGEPVAKEATWWRTFYDADKAKREKMLAEKKNK